MKVRLTKEAKKWLTLEQAPIARQIIKGEKRMKLLQRNMPKWQLEQFILVVFGMLRF